MAYRPLFQAVVFTVFACGFRARCALEVDNSGVVRLETIIGLIRQCRFGVHDLSRTDLSARGSLPRFNMPLELGLFLGAMRFGGAVQKDKRCLILDSERERYRDFISDLAGQDIKAHGDNLDDAIGAVRDFLRASSETGLPGGGAIASDHTRFRADFPALLRAARLKPNEVTFADLTLLVTQWLQATGGQN